MTSTGSACPVKEAAFSAFAIYIIRTGLVNAIVLTLDSHQAGANKQDYETGDSGREDCKKRNAQCRPKFAILSY